MQPTSSSSNESSSGISVSTMQNLSFRHLNDIIHLFCTHQVHPGHVDEVWRNVPLGLSVASEGKRHIIQMTTATGNVRTICTFSRSLIGVRPESGITAYCMTRGFAILTKQWFKESAVVLPVYLAVSLEQDWTENSRWTDGLEYLLEHQTHLMRPYEREA